MIKAPEFSGISNLRITLIEYKPLKGSLNSRSAIMKKAFKLATLKKKGYASLWYDILKKKSAREAEGKLKT